MPSLAEAHYWRGRALEAQERWVEAHRAYRAALRADPDHEAAEEARDALDIG